MVLVHRLFRRDSAGPASAAQQPPDTTSAAQQPGGTSTAHPPAGTPPLPGEQPGIPQPARLFVSPRSAPRRRGMLCGCGGCCAAPGARAAAPAERRRACPVTGMTSAPPPAAAPAPPPLTGPGGRPRGAGSPDPEQELGETQPRRRRAGSAAAPPSLRRSGNNGRGARRRVRDRREGMLAPGRRRSPRGGGMLAPSRRRAVGREGLRQTHPDDHRLLALEFGDEFVPPEDLCLVEGPEPAHHFDAALCGIRHLGGRAGAGRRERGAPPGRCRRRRLAPAPAPARLRGAGRGGAARSLRPLSRS